MSNVQDDIEPPPSLPDDQDGLAAGELIAWVGFAPRARDLDSHARERMATPDPGIYSRVVCMPTGQVRVDRRKRDGWVTDGGAPPGYRENALAAAVAALLPLAAQAAEGDPAS